MGQIPGASGWSGSNAICLTSDNSVYVTGSFEGSLDTHLAEGPQDIFITKYTKEGTKEWTNTLGSSANDAAFSIAACQDNSIVVTGYTEGDLDGNINSGGYDAFITKYASDGSKAWTKLLGSKGSDQAYGIATSRDGSIYVTGYTDGILPGLGPTNSFDVFIVKYSSDGDILWLKLLSSSGNDFSRGIATGSDGSIFITGHSNGNLGGNQNQGSFDSFVSKFKDDGTNQWTHLLGSSADDFGTAIVTDPDGAIVATGYSYTNYDSLPYLVKYNNDGDKQWLQNFESGNSQSSAVSIGDDNSIYIAGFTTTNLDGNENKGQWDMFVSDYSPQGDKLWTTLIGSAGAENAASLLSATDNVIYIAGTSSGGKDGLEDSDNSGSFVAKFESLPRGSNSPSKSPKHIQGSTGDDLLYGEYGDDVIYGQEGNDYIVGDRGNDNIQGDEGNDSMRGDAGNDTLKGGYGSDILIGGVGDDSLDGGPGADKVDYLFAAEGFINVDLTTGKATGDGIDTLSSIENVAGSSGGDTLNGNSMDNTFLGRSGADVISGGRGKDVFLYSNSKDSCLTSFDWIKDLTIDTDIIMVNYKIVIQKGSVAGANGSILRVSSLTESEIQKILTRSVFSSCTTAVFTVTSSNSIKTFLAINDSIPGFQAASDYLINITGYKGYLANIEVVTGYASNRNPIPTYLISTDSSIKNEGETLKTTITTTNVEDGSTLYWKLSGAGIDSTDFINNSLIGSGTISNGELPFSIPIASDAKTEGDENLAITLYTDQSFTAQVASTTTTIKDSSKTPLYTLAMSSTSANEGDILTSTISTTNVEDGSTLYWKLSGAGIDSLDFSNGSLVGSGIVKNGKYNILHAITRDFLTEGDEKATVSFYDSFMKPVATSTITIRDTSITPPGVKTDITDSTEIISLSENGSTFKWKARLTTKPTDNVVVTYRSSDSSEGLFSNGKDIFSLTFTPGNWDIDQKIEIKAVDDEVNDGDVKFTIIGSAYSDKDTSYQGISKGSFMKLGLFSVQNKDDDIPDDVRGTDQNDVLQGGPAISDVYGLLGNDNIKGGKGNDRLYGGYGDDLIYGQEGNDQLEGEQGNDFLHGDAGNDNLNGGTGNDDLFGGIGNDVLDGDKGADKMYGGDGSDTYYIENPGDYVSDSGKSGIDIVYIMTYLGSSYRLGDGLDGLVIDSKASNVSVTGNESDNDINGNDSNNTIDGGNGNDDLSGGGGVDSIMGGQGSDKIDGGNGDDIIKGGDGSDLVIGGVGRDVLDGGAGIDTVDYSDAAAGAVNVNLTTGKALGDGIDSLTSIENIICSEGDDTITGSNADNVLTGGDGTDLITGGSGKDVFRYSKLLDSDLRSCDWIKDLVIGTDSIDSLYAVSKGSIVGSKTGSTLKVASLTETSIRQTLTTSVFTAKGAAVFTYTTSSKITQTFLALNDTRAGFQSTSDALINITGYSGSLANLTIF